MSCTYCSSILLCSFGSGGLLSLPSPFLINKIISLKILFFFTSQEDEKAMFCELQCAHSEHAVESCGTKDQPGDQRQTPSFLRNGHERATSHQTLQMRIGRGQKTWYPVMKRPATIH